MAIVQTPPTSACLVVTDDPKIGLAFSGGGFRATCFGLGCLRALNDRDLLKQVSVVSGISGGALIAALYAYGPSAFDELDDLVVSALGRGLESAALLRVLRPTTMARNAFHSTRALVDRRPGARVLRGANRTDALRDTLQEVFFGERTLPEVSHPELATVITATDLRTSKAVRFGSLRSSCSAHGVIEETVSVAEAVAASAAFPLYLPAIDREFTFRRNEDVPPTRHIVSLTDGGVYDNLALSVLEPGRSPSHTPHVYDVDYIVAADAGRGPLSAASPRFMFLRLVRSYDIIYGRGQDQARGRMHEAARAGSIRGFIHAYLGMQDSRWPIPISDTVPLNKVRNEPTNFASMSEERVTNVALRGEQLMTALIAHYLPEL
jgi:predicted acylesterase/phospholipase RssA